MLRRAYAAVGVLLLGGYVWVAFTGREFGSPRTERAPQEVLRNPSALRSWHSGWHGGYRGGK